MSFVINRIATFLHRNLTVLLLLIKIVRTCNRCQHYRMTIADSRWSWLMGWLILNFKNRCRIRCLYRIFVCRVFSKYSKLRKVILSQNSSIFFEINFLTSCGLGISVWPCFSLIVRLAISWLSFSAELWFSSAWEYSYEKVYWRKFWHVIEYLYQNCMGSRFLKNKIKLYDLIATLCRYLVVK